MTFQEIKEQYIKPPFKYWVLPHGCYRGSFYTFNTIREAKTKAEELFLQNGADYWVMNVWHSKNPERKGYMSSRILAYDKDIGWFKIITDQDLTLHTAFFFDDFAVRKWNPALYDKLKTDWKSGKYDETE